MTFARVAADTIGNRASVGLWIGLAALVALVLLATVLTRPKPPR